MIEQILNHNESEFCILVLSLIKAQLHRPKLHFLFLTNQIDANNAAAMLLCLFVTTTGDESFNNWDSERAALPYIDLAKAIMQVTTF
jgi:hypothetical protein